MRRIGTVLILVVLLVAPRVLIGQSASSVTVPRLIQITGVFQPVDGQPPSAVEIVSLSVYSDADGGLPVWQERQTVPIETTTGRFTLLLGASNPAGIPPEVFGSGDAQWMSMLFERAGEREQPRVRIASVPYALKASDAETLGGLPASAYLRAPTAGAAEGGSGQTSMVTSAAVTEAAIGVAAVLPGTTNFLAKYVNGADVGDSAVYESGGMVGVGTTTPFDQMHLRFANTNGAFTGLAVQNLSNTATSYSGMLFYDQNNALGQFQGFNNVTHEYRINNIARVSPGGAFDGSINFMTGSTSRFFVRSNGNIGIGTTTPSALLEISNAVSAVPANMWITSYTNLVGPYFMSRRARGTPDAPTAVLAGDFLAGFFGHGHGTTGFSGQNSGMTIDAAENWTDTAQATRIQFRTTNFGTVTPVNRMTIDASGNLGLGTNAPQAALDMVRESPAALDINLTRYSGASDSGEPNILLRTARGTRVAPTAVQFGDELGGVSATGYGATSFGEGGVGFGGFAAENWTDTAQGAALGLAATPLGSTEAEVNLVILPGGNVGIGTFNAFPTITDRLQVFGDIRVGTSGTDGCIRNFAGTGIVGTCSSDRRFKKDITPFNRVLNQLAALQPVHYFWRAADFPQQNFGDSRAYGLIAQDVEAVLPELVVTGDDGFKAVDYTKLPLLTIQAMKELKAENDALKAGNEELKAGGEALKQRVEDLERLVTEMLAKVAQR